MPTSNKKTSSRKTKPSKKAKGTTPVLDDEQITKWLLEQPDFFIRNPNTLESLDLPSDTGAAISMHQYQVRVLREEKSQLLQKLAALLKNVKTNHKINADLLDLAGKMLRLTKQKADLSAHLNAIEKHFALFSVRYFDKAKAAEQFELIKASIGKQDCYCNNKMKPALLSDLFGDDAPAVQSLAMVPVTMAPEMMSPGMQGKKRQKNLPLAYLCLAADDADRFTPKMGDAFLKLLAHLIASAQ